MTRLTGARMVVDDEPAILRALSLNLSRHGFHLVTEPGVGYRLLAEDA